MQQNRWRRDTLLLLLVSALFGEAGATIEDASFADTRALSMGGAISASVDDATVGLINPAALGFMARESESDVDNNGLGDQTFGWSFLDIGVEATLTGELGDYLQVLADADFSKFRSPLLQDPDNIKSLIELAGTLGNVSDEDTIVVNGSVGSMMQIGHFGIGIRTFGQIGGWINELDLTNIGLEMGAGLIADELRQAMDADGFDPTGYDLQTLSAESVQKLRDAFGAPGSNEDVLSYIDFKTTELVDQHGLDSDKINGAVDALADIIEASGIGGNLSDNQTSITGRGFLAAEIPVSYGYAFNGNFSVGVTAKAIFGRVYGTQVWAFNEDNEEILENSLDSSVDRVNLGLDAAMMYRIPKWQFALVGHNLNSPRFDGYDQTVPINGTPTTIHVPDVVLDPQITFGAAWIPVRRLTLATDVELLETGTLLNGYDVQRLSFGTEWDLSLLALRLGTYKNIAESDLGWVLTGGVGFNLWAVSVDLGAAVSINDTVTYDGMDLPRTARIHAAVSMDF